MSRRQHSLKRASSTSSVLAIALAVAGCQSESARPAGKASAGPTTSLAGQARSEDACAQQMHDLCGYILEYSLIHHELPQTLMALQSVVDVGKTVPTLCPTNGKPYRYFPEGLVAAGDDRMLIVFDTDAIHEGKRMAILAQMPEPHSAKPLTLWVVQLPDEAIKVYRPRP